MSKTPQPNLDSVASLKSDGSRNFLKPSDVQGRFTTARRITALILIVIYVGLPWIPIGGYPALFFDLGSRRFHLFGLTFAAQDFWLSFFLISGLGFALFMITSILGRVWCGWTCPHTVFLEHVYRRIERWIEGPVADQRRLERLPWSNREKQLKKGFKQFLFILVSVLITHVFLSYFVPIPELYKWITTSPFENWAIFLFMLVTSGLLYFNFSWFREQLCLAICPYGRLQSALIDEDSIIIGYDEIRGEPRGKPRQEGVGDCIDCKRCITVCPTGIDIRQGLQMECVGCANCIDACDLVMTRLGRSKGLIRYDSLNGFNRMPKRILRPRIYAYFFFLALGIGVMMFAMSRVSDSYFVVTRMAGPPYFQTEERLRNQFNIRIVNKTKESRRFTMEIASGHPQLQMAANPGWIEVKALDEVVVPLVVIMPSDSFETSLPLEVHVRPETGRKPRIRQINFLGPDRSALNRELVFE